MTYFIKLENGLPVSAAIIEQNLKQVVPELANTNFFTPGLVEPYGYGIYQFSNRPVELAQYKKVIEITPVKDSMGIWTQTWAIEDMTQEEKQQADADKARSVRGQRGVELMRTDWTQLPDAPLTTEKKLQWAQYRQQLRDVTNQQGFPWQVEWPTKPE